MILNIPYSFQTHNFTPIQKTLGPRSASILHLKNNHNYRTSIKKQQQQQKNNFFMMSRNQIARKWIIDDQILFWEIFYTVRTYG